MTRALGQYEFKKSTKMSTLFSSQEKYHHIHQQIVTCYPETYIWPLTSISKPQSSSTSFSSSCHCYLALYSDSFTEALRDHRSGRIISSTGRPEQVIGNFLNNHETLEFILYELKKHHYDVEVAAQDIAETQVHKFYMYNSYFGDNTSIILVDLGILGPSKGNILVEQERQGHGREDEGLDEEDSFKEREMINMEIMQMAEIDQDVGFGSRLSPLPHHYIHTHASSKSVMVHASAEKEQEDAEINPDLLF